MKSHTINTLEVHTEIIPNLQTGQSKNYKFPFIDKTK